MKNDLKNKDYPKPAGFWIRVFAISVDSVLFSPIFLIQLHNLFSLKNYYLHFILSIPGILYKPFMEYYYGATLGKMIFKLKVIDANGKKLDIKHSCIRSLPFIISSIVSLGVVYVLFSWSEFKTATTINHMEPILRLNPLKPYQDIITLLLASESIFAAFTYRKRALHDIMANSYCVYKASYQ